MRKYVTKLFLALLIPVLVSCGSSEKTGYHGYLYFAKGAYLMRFSLRDADLSVAAILGEKTIRDVSPFGENKLLIAESESVNRQKVHRISWVDVKTGQVSALYSGVIARYLPHSGLIIYDDGLKLFEVAIAGDSSSEIIFSHKMNQVSTVMVVSDDIVLFETIDTGQRLIRSYDVLTGALHKLDRLSTVCRLEQAIWIDDLDQLACKQQTKQADDAHYVLVNLDGETTGSLALPKGKRFDALAYVSAQNALILTESWRGMFGGEERSSVWVYDIHSGESHLLAKNQNLGSSVVYTDF
jgi:hypothetical protein